MNTITSTLTEPFDHDHECVSASELEHAQTCHNIDELTEDISMKELNAVHSWLSIAGSLENYTPLHHQIVLRREIIASESARLHLLWFGKVIYVKPLPPCLMNTDFVRNYVCTNSNLHQSAMGFLLSYCKIVCSPLDLSFAKERLLLPEDITWTKWKLFREQTLSRIQHGVIINPRYIYGELRIARLNIIYRMTRRGLVYFSIHREYDSYFSQYFTLLIIAFAFASTVLSAMQVILSTPEYPQLFSRDSYVVSVVTILGILIALFIIACLFLWVFLANTYMTARSHLRPKRGKGGTA
ncbi:uncharacterized protein BCR38DRAFT_443123 [Pseudomassariella vexata]|uniref:Uncharacterized protein n=1 Tax=Pseudomassariella vexata TaxID=1141098 RepID=A0A1Y2DNY2_9PEZI|nr:uncharacterized protein BCR38DRAFT_443123 [Pseudomassariella vexata]ORY60982.1 hypothetical protein BCR38DRAFT_443123 [Pseudomassariella vexata]